MEENCTVRSTSASITVEWNRQYAVETAAPNEINSYTVKYRVYKEKDKPEFSNIQIGKDDNELEIKFLKPETDYEINVYWCNEDGDSLNLFKEKCRTGESKVKFLIETASSDKTQHPIIHHLKPVSTIEHKLKDGTGKNDTCIRILDMIANHKPDVHSSEEKTVLLLGGTGTGKSTMIDALINFIAEVSFTDDFRFGLICKTELEKDRAEKQFQSQTSSVTVYRIPRIKGLKISCGINIIDTPGFNDTRKDFDKTITNQIKELFDRGITHLNAILIVLPLSTKRLTPGQKHIFSSILDMFGHDITDNIFITLTHDDSGEEHTCLSVLRNAGVPFKDYFRFNNANIFSKSKSSEENFNKEFWKKRTDNFSILFKTLEKTKPIAITSSINVMRARTMLEIQLKALEDVLSQQAQYIANYKEDKIVIKAIENESPENIKVSKYQRIVPETIEVGTFRESLNCPNCRITCHRRCWVPLNMLNFTCEVMVDDKCTVCIGKCYATDHELSRKIYQIKYVKKLFSGEEVKTRHQKREETFKILKDTICLIEHCIAEINRTALTKDVLSATEYIHNIADKEIKKKKEGYEMRIQIHQNIINHLKQNSTSNLSMDYLIEN